ncbi:MAG: hypothetical protein LH631_09280 [Alkalinema sp. CAN_BIN05]|nr:hypothetical protein [Alkalinema sp. CAN_BIN05]
MSVAVEPPVTLTSQISDLRLAAQKMTGVERRGFQAQMSLKSCMEMRDKQNGYWAGVERP